MKKIKSPKIQVLEESIKLELNNIDGWNRETISGKTTDFTEKDKNTFYRLINVKIIRPYLLSRLSIVRPELSRELHKIKPLHEFAKFIIYIHDGLKSKEIPLDTLWSDLCGLPYILKYDY